MGLSPQSLIQDWHQNSQVYQARKFWRQKQEQTFQEAGSRKENWMLGALKASTDQLMDSLLGASGLQEWTDGVGRVYADYEDRASQMKKARDSLFALGDGVMAGAAFLPDLEEITGLESSELIKKEAEAGKLELGKLRYLGNKMWESGAGLMYGPCKRMPNRVLHALEHLKIKPIPAKRIHTVFIVSRRKLLNLLDEAWARRKGFKSFQDTIRTIYEVPMGRVVGTEGETVIRIVVKKGNHLITAYPVKKI